MILNHYIITATQLLVQHFGSSHGLISKLASCLPLRPHLRRVVTLCVCRYWVVTRLFIGCVRPHACVRATCVSRWSLTSFCWVCTASCGCHMRCMVDRGDAWRMLLSPSDTSRAAGTSDPIHPPPELLHHLLVCKEGQQTRRCRCGLHG